MALAMMSIATPLPGTSSRFHSIRRFEDTLAKHIKKNLGLKNC